MRKSEQTGVAGRFFMRGGSIGQTVRWINIEEKGIQQAIHVRPRRKLHNSGRFTTAHDQYSNVVSRRFLPLARFLAARPMPARPLPRHRLHRLRSCLYR